MFSAKAFLSFCKADMKPSKWQKELKGYLKSKDFYGWLFNPAKDDIVDYAGLTEQVYGSLCEDTDKLNLIVDLISDDPTEFGRATAAFLYSLFNYGIDTANAAFKTIEAKLAEKEITRSEAQKKNSRIEEYCELLDSLNSALLSIIKKDAKRLTRKSGIQKSTCKSVLKQIPEPIFVPNNKVGVYLNLILKTIYEDINTNDTDIDDIDWKEFFSVVMGEDNLYDVASFVLLETPNHIQNLSSKSVRKVWDSLTDWSLSVLEKTDEGTRSHMLELYIKRLASAVDNKDLSVRVDLRNLSAKDYPKLTKTICGYADKFDAILKPFSASSLVD